MSAAKLRLRALQKPLVIGAAGVHLLLISLISTRDIARLIEHKLTIAPEIFQPAARQGDELLSKMIDAGVSKEHPLRQTIQSYARLAGIQNSYGFFAPNVPESYRLMLELRTASGQTVYRAAAFTGSESNLRLASLMDYLGRVRYEPGREFIVQALAQAFSRMQPEVESGRAFLSRLDQPAPADVLTGEKAGYEVLQSYEFAVKQNNSGERSAGD